MKEEYLRQVEESFYLNGKAFSDEISRLYALPTVLETTPQYANVSYINGPLPANRYYALTDLRKAFAKQTALLRVNKDGFFIFSKSGAGGTTTAVYPDMRDCFSEHTTFENLSAEELIEEVKALSSIRIFQQQRVVKGVESDDCVLILVHSSSLGSALVIGVLYPVQSILDSFDYDALPANSGLKLQTWDGTVILNERFEENRSPADSVFTYSMNAINANISLYIPQNYFEQVLNPIRSRSIWMTVLVLIIGAILCVLFSMFSVQPLRQLIAEMVSGTRLADDTGNEIIALRSYLKQTEEKQKKLDRAILYGLLDRAFYGMPINATESREISLLIPILRNGYYVAIIRNLQVNAASSERAFDLINQKDSSFWYMRQINVSDMGLLVAGDEKSKTDFLLLIQKLNGEMNAGASFICGISQLHHGSDRLNIALRQAYASVSGDKDLIVRFYTQESEEIRETKQVYASGELLEQFYQALCQWDEDGASAALDNFEPVLHYSEQPNEVVASLIFMIRDMAGNAGIPVNSGLTVSAFRNLTSSEVIFRLKEELRQIFLVSKSRQDSQKEEIQTRILDYIEEHLADNSLCQDGVADLFGVSQRFVIGTIENKFGKSFSKWLLDIRMKKAADLLKNSDRMVEEISEQCGFSVQSTFYRAFKKQYGVTPAKYREIYRSIKEA